MMNERSVLTVTQVNRYVKSLLDNDEALQYLWVRGEISNFKRHYATGHLYFSLKDEEGLIRAVMFRFSAEKMRFSPTDGMKVLARGKVSAFPRDGQYQLYVEEMQPDGMGTLYLAFEQLRAKLAAEGLFAAEKKKPIPKYPERIGIITSATGAAIHDMITVTGRRYPAAELYLYPSQVQGPEAPRQLIGALEYFNRTNSVDVIIIGRGGGSLEDLWAFNNETLARAVASSKIPVISAVGHESDFTICDFVADLRAATPSAAAELAVPSAAQLSDAVSRAKQNLNLAIGHKIDEYRRRLNAYATGRALSAPIHLVTDRRMTLALLEEKLDTLTDRRLSDRRSEFAAICGKLDSLNPLSVLSRGFAAVRNENGEIVKSAQSLRVGERLRIRFFDGEADTLVENVPTVLRDGKK